MPHKDKQEAHEYNIKRRDKQREYAKKYYKKNKNRLSELKKKYTEKMFKNPVNVLMHKARYGITHALRDGRIFKMPCEKCGNPKVVAHHCDYNKPFEVMWLCRIHHAEWHYHNKPILPKGFRHE